MAEDFLDHSVSESASLSCEAPVVAGLGRQSVAVDQSPGGGDNYPFVGDSDIGDLLADAYLSYRDDDCRYARPFRIRWLYGFGCLKALLPVLPKHNYDVLVEDANGLVVFDSRQASQFTTSLWGERLRVLQWQAPAVDGVLRIVQHIAWTENITPRNWPVYLEPVNGQLDDRVAERLLPRVRSLRVPLGSKLQGAVQLTNGYNTTLEVEEVATEDGGRFATPLVVSAAPGSGRGKFGPACEPLDGDTAGVLRRVNNIPGDKAGNFLLDATDCYRIERPIHHLVSPVGVSPRRVSLQNHALQLFNDCGPCCECQDFINTYEGIRRLRDRYASLFARANAVRNLYVKNRARVLASAACRAKDPLRVLIRAICPDEIAVAVGFCNNSDDCLHTLVLPISFEFEGAANSVSECDADTVYSGGGNPDVVCNSTFRDGNRETNPGRGTRGRGPDVYKLGGSYPHYYAAWDRVDPGSLAQVTFRVSFPGSRKGDTAQVSVDAYSLSDSEGTPLTGTGSKFPIPGYVPGAGPVTATALSLRLVEQCKVVQAAMLQEPCCDDEELEDV